MENIASSDFPRGSEWRRWDLHVHTPESRLGSSFKGVAWNDYVNALESAAEAAGIAVIGVTDYMCVDGYERLLTEVRDPSNPRLSSTHLILPNIELRAQPLTSSGKALNIHLLVDPTESSHVEKIKRALTNLRVPFDGQFYGCIRPQLIEYARAQNPTLTNDEAAYTFGVLQFKPGYQDVLDWLRTEKWLRANCLVGISNGKDGISGLPVDGFAAVRDQILKNADFVFSGNPTDRSYFLGQKVGVPLQEIKRMYGSSKPCVHGSDAHAVAQLFKPDGDRRCWIKSDPTFEGLRQILWEPESRIYIGPTQPGVSERTRVVSELRPLEMPSWFSQDSIQLNDGLVAIIGEKGSGKTALADLIAFAAGEEVPAESQSSFISKGRVHLGGGQPTLAWGDGAVTAGTLLARPFMTPKSLVRYLSQDFVERLCSTDSEGHELQEAIEAVVFSHLNEEIREGHSSFEELRASRETTSQTRQDILRGELASLHREVERHLFALAQVPQKKAYIAHARDKAEKLKALLPEIELSADQAVLAKLNEAQVSLTEHESAAAKISRRRRSLDEFLSSYKDIRARATKSIQDLIASLGPNLDVPADALTSLLPSWNAAAVEQIEKSRDALDQELMTIRGDADHPSDGTIAALKKTVEKLKEQLSKDEVNRNRLLDVQKQIAEQESAIKRLQHEIDGLNTKTTAQLEACKRQRNQAYADYFEALAADATGLEELYAPMKGKLGELGADAKFSLSSGYQIDLRAWLDKSSRFYDGRKPQALAKKDEVERYAVDKLVPAWKSGDRDAIAQAIGEFHDLIDPPRFMTEMSSPSLKMVDLFDWLYSTDHIRISYKILYDEIELEYLSPGTRGIALLVLYLLLDDDDRRPLLIDQPEGNLDNSSVFQQLVPYIRAAKQKRQIILITHNPNLVVGADAEQVIVATAVRVEGSSHPTMTYFAGALEHLGQAPEIGIRKAVCTLLEGGEAAFKERESRYAIEK